jgi:hypothetical protein
MTLMPNEGMSTVIGDTKEVPMVPTGGWPVKCDADLDFVTPQLRHVLKVWQSRRGARTMPSRADMTMADLKSVLPNLAFLGVVREGDRLRYKVRLMGGVLDDYLTPMTGRFVDEALPAHFAEKWTTVWRPAIDSRAPVRSVGRVEYGARRWCVAEALYAPLADDGATPDVLMIAVHYHVCAENGAQPSAIAARLTGELGDDANVAMA